MYGSALESTHHLADLNMATNPNLSLMNIERAIMSNSKDRILSVNLRVLVCLFQCDATDVESSGGNSSVLNFEHV